MMSVLYGVVAGVLRALVGWAKANEPFYIEKFAKTLVIFAVTGFVLGLYIADPLQVFAMSFIGVPLEELISLLLDQSKKKK